MVIGLSGCASTPKLKVVTTQAERQKLNLPSVDQVMNDPVRWLAIVKNAPKGQKGSIEYFWQQMEKNGHSTGVALSPKDFRNMSRNNAKLRKYILQQKAIIRAYKKYYNENK